MIGIISICFLVYIAGMVYLGLYQHEKKRAELQRLQEIEDEKEERKQHARYLRQQKKAEKYRRDHPEEQVPQPPGQPGQRVVYDGVNHYYVVQTPYGPQRVSQELVEHYPNSLRDAYHSASLHSTSMVQNLSYPTYMAETSLATLYHDDSPGSDELIRRDNMLKALHSMRDNISVNPETFKGFLDSIEKGGIDKT